jgi:hypothetical protein
MTHIDKKATTGIKMTEDKPSAALTARLRTKGVGSRNGALIALSGALRPLEKQSKDFNYVSRR